MRALVLVIAVVANVVTWSIASAAGVDFEVAPPDRDPMEVAVVAVVLMTVLFGGLGWAARAVLDRIAKRRAAMIWAVVAAIVLVVSFLPQFSLDATTGAKTTLSLMHVIVALALFPVLARKLPNARA